MSIGRPTGRKNRKWTKEEKLRIVHRYLNEHIGRRTLAKEEEISSGLIYTWIKKYLDYGESGFEDCCSKRGNAYAALHTSKSLSEVERLRIEVAKQEVEIERLKKGYYVKGDGVNKAFVITKDVSLKLLIT